MHILKALGRVTPHAHGLDAELETGMRLAVRAMGEHLLRVTIAPASGMPVDRTWMIAPEGDTPWQGRDRDDLAGFAPPAGQFESTGAKHVLTAGSFRLTLSGPPARLDIEQRVGDAWRPWIADRATGGFALAEKGTRLRHYQRRNAHDMHFALGDKTGPLDRTGRRFRLLQLDALGFDAEIGDPQYKHIPFMIVRGSAHEPAVSGGLFYDTLAPMTFDVGAERSNYHGIYRYVEAEEPALDLWLIAGPDVANVVKRFTLLTGRPALPPRWSFGFAFTTMHHADDANAQAVIAAFADRCRAEAIPISAIHFGSGYSSRGKRRYVFTWNRDKFPDPKALFAKLKGMGLPTVANLKPVLIDDHPDYASVRAASGFIKSADGAPVLEQFWDGMGSYLDFSNAETIRWWQERFKRQVLDVGFTAGWNDNNEHEIGRDDATATGFGKALSATATRPLHALLMTRATYEASTARDPNVRPFTITRAGPAGIQRYGETWTGDNATSWHTLKWNLRNGLSLALSGQSNVGHDIGGFTGPRPSPELLCRFVEMMALHPRAVMNSWKPEVANDWSAATTPWLYPDMTAKIRDALRLRTTFMPLMYTLAHRYHRHGEPIIRPLLYDFPEDPVCLGEHDAMMLGPNVLFSPVVDEGARTKTQYLPQVPFGWYDYHTGQHHAGGRSVAVDAPLGRPPVFVRGGAALVLAEGTPHIAPHDAPPRRLYLATVGETGSGSGSHFEDDGSSQLTVAGGHCEFDLALHWQPARIVVRLNRTDGSATPAPASDWVVTSSGIERPVEIIM